VSLMIRYDISLQDIKKRIENLKGGAKWLTDAKSRTAKFRKAKRYKEASSSWSKIKIVYMEMQHAKCAYCERKLESGAVGKIEWDIEHYRPKSKVKAWPPAKLAKKFSYDFPLGPASNNGYYLLPYDLSNYLTACKVCNSPHKSDFFPIAATRRILSSNSPAKLAKERPFLPYPIGKIDEDPESILTFQGFICIAAAGSGHKRDRGLVTIDFFGLNDRDTLLQERAELIVTTWAMLDRLNQDPSDVVATTYMERIRSDAMKHANCGRSFLRTYGHDRNLAATYVRKADDYLKSKNA
jgi:hypothetical protein